MNGLPFAGDDLQIPVAGMVVLAEDEFTAALQAAGRAADTREGARWAPLDAGAVEAGAVIAGRANHPGTTGILARATRARGAARVPFSGRLFALLPEPSFDDGYGLVSAERFRIAAVELSGTASWVGTDARLSASLGAVEAGRCCGPQTVCAPPTGGGGDDPPVLLSTPTVGVANQPGDLYSSRGTQRPSAGTVPYDVYGAGVGDRRPVPGDGLPDPGGGGVDPGGGRPDPLTGIELVCVDVRDPDCDIAHPVCGPDDVGFTTTGDDAADVPVGSSNCPDQLTRPVRGLNVPESCTYAYFGGDTTDPACRGTYGGPPLPFLWRQQPDDLGDPPEPLMCRVARWVPGSGSPCETTTERWNTAHNAELALELGGVLPGETKQHCDPADERGIQRCVTCTGDVDGTAECGESVVKPLLDPALAVDPGTDKYGQRINPDGWWKHDPSTDPPPTPAEPDPVVALPGSGTPPSTDPPKVPDTPKPAPTNDPPKPSQPAKDNPAGPKPPIPHPDVPVPTHAGGTRDTGAIRKRPSPNPGSPRGSATRSRSATAASTCPAATCPSRGRRGR